MSGYLADTNTISEYAKQKPDPRVVQWLERAEPDTRFVSVITLGEVRLGIESLPRVYRHIHFCEEVSFDEVFVCAVCERS